MAGHEPDSRTEGLRHGRAGLWLAAAAALFGCLILYAGLVEPYEVRLERVSVKIDGLPDDLAGLKILHLSDLESTGIGLKEEKVAALGREADADLVVMTGDLVAKSLRGEVRRRVTEEAADLVGGLPSRLGRWFVEGHGERTSDAIRMQTATALGTRGVTYLDDEVDSTMVGGTRLAIVGFGVHSYSKPSPFRAEGDHFVQDGLSAPGSYLDLNVAPGELPRDYELSGEFRFSSDRSGIGVTFYNQLPMNRDRFYRLRRTASKKQMHLSPHGTVFSAGRSAYPAVTHPGIWYGFRVNVTTDDGSTHVRAKVWPAEGPEPPLWGVDCIDATSTRIEGGTLGLWSAGPGRKEFRDLVLKGANGVRRLEGDGAGSAEWSAPKAPDFILSASQRIPQGAWPLVLSHTPDVFPYAAAMGWPLVLAGHTQGGQIRIPFIGVLTTDTELGRHFASGLFRKGPTQLFITRGVGTTRVPFRFLVPPEVALITLERAPAEGAGR